MTVVGVMYACRSKGAGSGDGGWGLLGPKDEVSPEEDEEDEKRRGKKKGAYLDVDGSPGGDGQGSGRQASDSTQHAAQRNDGRRDGR